jgi:ferric-dicitrate binding protein FerR (iron transport regulator)
VSADEPTPRPRAPRPRRPPRRKVPLALAGVVCALALLAGLVVGYAVRGDDAPGGLVTETRQVPVVTVTVPAEE